MKLLVGFDGSNSSKAALDVAQSYADALDASVEIVNSLDSDKSDDVAAIKKAEERMTWAEQHLQTAGLTAKAHLLIRGLSPGEDVVQFADEQSVDAIFIGVRRRSKVGKLLFGSNAQYIILNAPCPVMTVR